MPHCFSRHGRPHGDGSTCLLRECDALTLCNAFFRIIYSCALGGDSLYDHPRCMGEARIISPLLDQDIDRYSFQFGYIAEVYRFILEVEPAHSSGSSQGSVLVVW